MSILIAILIFAILVIIHEFGHFIVAKWSGVLVQEFAIGFPPRIWGFKRGETQYSINALPLGGYVLMPGENGDIPAEIETTNRQGETVVISGEEAQKRSFAYQPASRRAAILVAGVTMNLLLAIVVYTGIFAAAGAPLSNYVGDIVAGSPAQQGGLQPGDRILSINGTGVSSAFGAQATICNIVKNSSGSTVPVQAVVERDGQQQTLDLIARRNPPTGQGNIGFAFTTRTQAVQWYQAPGYALHQVFVGNFQSLADGIRLIACGRIPVQDAFSGPVGIVKTTAQAASSTAQFGFAPIFEILAFLSWNLAFFNLIPIPGLDGGRLLLLGIEVLRRGQRLDPKWESLVNLAGLGFLLSLIVIFTINDVSHIISGR